MKKLDPSALTPDELEAGVTKLRYMQYRDDTRRRRGVTRTHATRAAVSEDATTLPTADGMRVTPHHPRGVLPPARCIATRTTRMARRRLPGTSRGARPFGGA